MPLRKDIDKIHKILVDLYRILCCNDCFDDKWCSHNYCSQKKCLPMNQEIVTANFKKNLKAGIANLSRYTGDYSHLNKLHYYLKNLEKNIK